MSSYVKCVMGVCAKEEMLFLLSPKMHFVGHQNMQRNHQVTVVVMGKLNDKQDHCKQGHLNWNNTLAEMGRCSNFEDLVKYVDRLGELPVLDKNFKGLRQINTDRRDFLAFESIPGDVGVSKEDLFPVSSSGAGSCFYYHCQGWFMVMKNTV